MCAAIVQGISAIYGIGSTTVSNAVVQSYTNDGEFNSEATVVDEDGLTVAWRGDDRKTQITVELIATSTTMPILGASFTIAINTDSSYTSGAPAAGFVGWVTKISDKGSNKGYSAITVTAVGYEAVI
jgi:hypothetical protein